MTKPKRKLICLEVNTPARHEHRHRWFPKMAAHAAMTFRLSMKWMVEDAVNANR